MEEKIYTTKKRGMLVLLITLALYIVAIAACAYFGTKEQMIPTISFNIIW